MLLIAYLSLILTFVSAQAPAEGPGQPAPEIVDFPGAGIHDDGSVPITPEHPENDVHVVAPPMPHPDIVEGVTERPPPPPHPEVVVGDGRPSEGETPPGPPAEMDAPPLPDAMPEQPPPDAPSDEVPPDAVPPPPEADPAAENPEPPPPPPHPNNPWRTPSPGQPAVEIQAGSAYNYTWTPNTEGKISLELWQIEDNTPVPKFLIASEVPNTGLYNWQVHRNFPHGTGYCLVIVPPDRNQASLSPLFTILGDIDYEMPVPINPEHQYTLNDLNVNLEGTQRKLFTAVAIGFAICNLVAAVAWYANDREGSLRDSHAVYSSMGKNTGKRVFHARNPSTMVPM